MLIVETETLQNADPLPCFYCKKERQDIYSKLQTLCSVVHVEWLKNRLKLNVLNLLSKLISFANLMHSKYYAELFLSSIVMSYRLVPHVSRECREVPISRINNANCDLLSYLSCVDTSWQLKFSILLQRGITCLFFSFSWQLKISILLQRCITCLFFSLPRITARLFLIPASIVNSWHGGQWTMSCDL